MGEEKVESKENEEKTPEINIALLDTYSLIALFINLLSARAWQDMGLIVSSQTKSVKKDMDSAKVAIDCVSFLINKLDPQLKKEEKDKFRALLTDLQLNFIQQQETK